MLRLNKISVLKKATILIIVPLVFELIVIAALSYYASQVEHWAIMETRARELMARIDGTEVAFSEYWLTGLAYKLNPSDELIERCAALEETIVDNMQAAEELVLKYHFDEKAFEKFKDAHEESLRVLGIMRSASVGESTFGLSNLTVRSLASEGSKRDLSSKSRMLASIDSQMKQQPQMLANSKRGVQLTVTGGIIGNVLLSIVVVIVFSRDIVDRLNLIIKNFLRYGKGEKLTSAVEGSDEIARLDRQFRVMSQRVDNLRARERTLLENLGDAVCSLDSESYFVQTNPAAYWLFEKEENEFGRTRLIDLVREDERPRLEILLSNAASAPGNTFFIETALQPSNKICQWSIRWSVDDELYFCVGHDVTSAKAIESLQRDFLNMITHDIRTPVTAMQCFLELLSEERYGALNDRGRIATSRLAVSLNQVFNLVSEFLEIEKLDYESFEIETNPIDITNVIRSARDLVSAIGEEKGITIIATADTAITVKGDEERLVRVVQNLLSNALRYSPAGSTITVEVDRSDRHAEVKVKDQGPGIPDELMGRIFDKYTQAEKKAQTGTSGLGLAICKKIVEKHGGNIGVVSDGSSGSCFWFSIPLAGPT